MNLFDMMAKAGERERLIAQGRALGLTDEQARLVVETLGPAALAGLQRAQADAGTVMRQMTEMGTKMMGAAANPAAGLNPFGASPAASVFGSPQAADAVADQIAKMTGADPKAMRQLVPAFSASILAQMAVLASLPALAPMKESLEGAIRGVGATIAAGGGVGPADPPSAAEPAAEPDRARQPDIADMMAPMTQFMQGLSAMMSTAMTPPSTKTASPETSREPDPDTAPDASRASKNRVDEGRKMPSLDEALEAQTQAWNAFLAGLAKASERPAGD